MRPVIMFLCSVDFNGAFSFYLLERINIIVVKLNWNFNENIA